MKISLLIRMLFLFLLIAGSCDTTNSGVDENDPSPPTINEQCKSADLAVNQAKPFEKVEVTGISNLTEYFYVNYKSASGTSGITPLLIEEGGKAVMVVPPNPDALMDGGELTFTVTDGDLECGDLKLTVEATDPVTGNPVGDFKSALEVLTSEFASQFNLDPATISATSLDQLPPQAIPIALMITALENFDPAATLSEMSSDEAAYTQALIGELQLAAQINEITESVKQLSRNENLTQPKERTTQPLSDCIWLGRVPADQFDMETGEDLSEYIKTARGAQDNIGPFSQTISSIGTAFAVVGLVAPNVGFIASYTLWFSSLIQQMRANLYPSSITKFEYRLDKTHIEEDWDKDRKDPDIKWGFAKIWATNTGMSLSRATFDLVTAGAPLGPGFKGAIGNVADTGFDMVAKDAINKRLDELGEDPGSDDGCWGIGATEFGPVIVPDNSGAEWVRAEITEGNAITIDDNDIRRIIPDRIGTATLRVRTQEDPFPGPFGFQDKQVEVLRKEVVWIPSTLLVKNPGETKTIKFRVDNSKHNGPEDITITPGPNLGVLPSPTYSNGVHTIQLPTPPDLDDYPTWIDVASTSKQLPPDTPERIARLDIFSKEDITISPRDECVGSDKRETLTATVSGPDELTVSWEIVSGGGKLSSTSGEVIDYIAPESGSGTVTIRAMLDQKPEITDEITLRYGVCSGLALFYGVTAGINFPFSPGGECSNPDLDDKQQELIFPEEAFEPDFTPSASSLWINRTEQFSASLEDSGVFGTKPSEQEPCVTSSFSADASYDATFTGSADGTQLDLDINTEAASNIEYMGEKIGEQQSTAASDVTVAARFDFEIKEASQYLLQIDLQCTGKLPPMSSEPFSNISVIMVQFRPDGSPRDPNMTTDPINATCDDTNPSLQINRALEFEQPDDGDTDIVIVQFQAQKTSVGAVTGLDDTGTEIRRAGSMHGSVSVTEQ